MRYSICFLFFSFSSLFALEEGEFNWDRGVPSVAQFNGYLQEAVQDKNWWAAIDYAEVIAKRFPDTSFAQESSFVLGESYYQLEQLELANESFTSYLSQEISPKHFKEAVQYKFAIAERFRAGAKKPLFGSHKLPKLLSGDEDAIAIYEEVIAAFPHDEMAIQSLLGKGLLQVKFEDYKPALETFDQLIRRFPKNELAAQAFLEKSRVYLEQSKERSLDPALLDLADLNLRKFSIAFPREERLQEVEENCSQVKEAFASHLLETGMFFQKTKKQPAAKLYYSKVLEQYPGTKAAVLAEEKLAQLEL
jgi:outer membrane protein assembly factor BamD (BamD/ComL family)